MTLRKQLKAAEEAFDKVEEALPLALEYYNEKAKEAQLDPEYYFSYKHLYVVAYYDGIGMVEVQYDDYSDDTISPVESGSWDIPIEWVEAGYGNAIDKHIAECVEQQKQEKAHQDEASLASKYRQLEALKAELGVE